MHHISLTRRTAISLAAAVALGVVAPAAFAQADYPTKPITVIVPFAAGGSTDITARLIADQLKTELNQTVLVDNRGGAGGAIGAAAAAKAAPDGYTILLSGTSTHAISPAMYTNLPYDANKDFIPVAIISEEPLVLVAPSSLGVKDFKGLVAYLKKNPLAYGSAGPGSMAHMLGAGLAKETGLDLDAAHYKTAGATVADLIAGRLSFLTESPSVIRQHLAEGTLVPVAALGPRRMEAFPNVPTMGELGIKSAYLTRGAWKGIWVPAGTPRPIVDKLNAAFNRAMKAPNVVTRLREGVVEPVSNSTPESAKAFIASEQEAWREAVKASGVVVTN